MNVIQNYEHNLRTASVIREYDLRTASVIREYDLRTASSDSQLAAELISRFLNYACISRIKLAVFEPCLQYTPGSL